MDGGDYARYIPPLASQFGGMFHAINRKKKSLALDLKDPRSGEIVTRLLETHDVLVESFRSGVMDRLGFGFDDLQKTRKDLIYLSLSGYGKNGPMNNRGGHDVDFQALSGMSSFIGKKGIGPVIPGVQIADMASGVFVALAIVAAVHRRGRTGQGEYLDLSMADCALSFMSVQGAESVFGGGPPVLEDLVLAGSTIRYNMYETKDGRFMAVGALEQKYWEKVCKAIGAPELAEEGFSAAKPENQHYKKVCGIFRSKTQAEWTDVFRSVDACVEPVLSIHETIAHPLFNRRGMIGKSVHPTEGEIVFVDTPIHPDGGAGSTPCPKLGEHTREVLLAHGFSEEEISRLDKDGVIRI